MSGWLPLSDVRRLTGRHRFSAIRRELDRQDGESAAQQFLGHRDARTTRRYLRDHRANVVRPLTRKKA